MGFGGTGRYKEDDQVSGLSWWVEALLIGMGNTRRATLFGTCFCFIKLIKEAWNGSKIGVSG